MAAAAPAAPARAIRAAATALSIRRLRGTPAAFTWLRNRNLLTESGMGGLVLGAGSTSPPETRNTKINKKLSY
jgi:hypothetical protein